MAAHTAHNFPDLDISPILPLDESRRDSDTSLQITVPLDYVADDGIFTSTAAQGSTEVVADSQTRIEENPDVTTNFDASLDSFGPRPTKDSIDRSSEEVFQRLQSNVRRSLLTSRSSGEDIFEEEEEEATADHSCMSTFLRGLMIYVDFQCCVESAETIRSKLRKMGALVTRNLSTANSHVVFSRGGRKSTLQTVLSMQDRPFLVDPDWVHACWFQQFRVPESSYNLYGCQYLLETLRRRSSVANENAPFRESASTDVIELSPDIELEPNLAPKNKDSHPRAASSLSLSEETELTFNQPMTATQLLQKIDKLSKRLDDLNTEPNPSHGSRCPSRQGETSRRTPLKSAATNTVAFTPSATKPLRRRTHGAFALAHRAPYSSAVSAMTALKEETEAEQGMQDLTKRLNTFTLNRRGPVNGIDDMRKTTQTDLNRIRQTLQNNSKYQKRKNEKAANNKNRPPVHPKPPRHAPVERQEDSEDSFHRTPRVPIRRPVVNTASDIINRLQNIPSSDEFAGNKQSRIKKMSVVFTGINKMEERTFRQIALDLSLTISNKVDHTTRCVVSGNGLRTLSTLRAVVLGIPIVTPEWLNDCDAEECLLSVKNYLHERWNSIIQQRRPKSNLFARFRWIYIADGCSPPSEELKWMIKKSGGQITPCPEDSSLIVSPKNTEILLPWNPNTQRDPPLIVHEQYILDCITENQVLCLEDYTNVSFSIHEN